MPIQLLIMNSNNQKARKRCISKFLYYFKLGYNDPTFIDWERQYKLNAHKKFQQVLNREFYSDLLHSKKYHEIANLAVKIESGTNLLFSFEKMALRDAVKSAAGAKAFSVGLFDYLYGTASLKDRFEAFVLIIGLLPRKQTRVLTWPIVTIFGFIGKPSEHIFLKPRVTQSAAIKYRFDFDYTSKPSWLTYKSLLTFAKQIKTDTIQYKPKDNIDLQSFIWVMGSDEYFD